jgi:hypothetical protein
MGFAFIQHHCLGSYYESRVSRNTQFLQFHGETIKCGYSLTDREWIVPDPTDNDMLPCSTKTSLVHSNDGRNVMDERNNRIEIPS